MSENFYPLPLSKLSAETDLTISPSSAWKRMRVLNAAHFYVPGAIATEILTHETEGLGVVRRVYSSKQSWVDETVMQWEDNVGFLLCVHRGAKGRMPAPLETVWFRYCLEPCARTDTCKVRLVFYYRLREMVWLRLFQPLLHLAFRMMLYRILRKLKMYYEIGYYLHPVMGRGVCPTRLGSSDEK